MPITEKFPTQRSQKRFFDRQVKNKKVQNNEKLDKNNYNVKNFKHKKIDIKII